MYLYYEQHKDTTGAVVLTEMRLSSSATGRLYIDHKSSIEQLLKGLCLQILKYPPIAQRSYDPATCVWSYFGDWGQRIIDKLVEVTKSIQQIGLIRVEDLSAQAINHYVSFRSSTPTVEEFFYTPVALVAPTKESLIERLTVLMGATLDKHSYRLAAMRLHPDRNNGDGTAMSELNSLWSIYNA